MRPVDQPRWDRAYSDFRDFAAEHGHGAVAKDYVSPTGTALGKWAANQRDLMLAGRLLPDRQRVLNADTAWVWSPREGAWETNHEVLLEFIRVHGRLPHLSESYEGLALGAWVRTQRRAHRERRMTEERTSRLDATPGWLWDARLA